MSFFEEKLIADLLKVDSGQSLRLTSRENSSLEFKQAFNWNNKSVYAKTMAAFSNARGGYIVFGVKNKPREIVGLQNNNFDNTDPETITQFLNTTFSPEIHWEMNQQKIRGKSIGLIYVHESACKPVVCMRNDSELKEAEIYYRYRGRSEKIKYSEMRTLLETARDKEKVLWMKHIEQIATVGVGNVGIFNPISGEVSGASGSFLISEELLPKLAFIKEGKFVETGGEPTLKLIGDVQSFSGGMQPIRERLTPTSIHGPEIVHAFLKKDEVSNAFEYVKAICHENSAYLPVYYFLHQAKCSIAEAILKLQEVESRYPAKANVIKRLQRVENLAHGKLTAKTEAASEKRRFKGLIKSKNVPSNLTGEELEDFLSAVTHLSAKEIEWDYLSSLMREIFRTKFDTASSSTAERIRKALCHLDHSLYRSKVKPGK